MASVAPPFVRLRNTAFPPHPLTFHLLHAVYCATVGTCGCVQQATAASRFDPLSRTRVVDARRTPLPETKTIWSRGTQGDLSAPLHPIVLELDEVKAAVAKGELQVVAEEPTPAEEPAPAEPTSAEGPAPAQPLVRSTGAPAEESAPAARPDAGTAAMTKKESSRHGSR